MTTQRDFTAHVDLDWTTWYCPCGASFCNRDDWDGVTAWRTEHLEHTSGYETIITTDRGASVYASHPPTERHKVGK